jgi:diguanylate cyclase (GGDEF)-like protein
MELLLWRWSTIVQVTSNVMIVLFFLSLAKSTQRVELRPWVNAWLANLAAITIAAVYWLWQPTSALLFNLTILLYSFSKTLFVLLMLSGTQRYTPATWLILDTRPVVYLSGIFALACGFLISTNEWLGMTQNLVVFIGFGVGSIMAMQSKNAALSWIALGFAARAILALFEVFSYGLAVTDTTNTREYITLFLAAHSSFDSAAEWCIALGCVLALFRTIQQEQTQTCNNLLVVKNELQDLVEHDTLTGLGNRRTLRNALERAKLTGASILFFDLNDFKQINDKYGHTVGDECLQRFARSLLLSFRPDDHIVRFAGDEFIVVAMGIIPEALQERIETTANHLEVLRQSGPKLEFSVGVSYLPVGGEPDLALHQADAAMYQQKNDVVQP